MFLFPNGIAGRCGLIDRVCYVVMFTAGGSVTFSVLRPVTRQLTLLVAVRQADHWGF